MAGMSCIATQYVVTYTCQCYRASLMLEVKQLSQLQSLACNWYHLQCVGNMPEAMIYWNQAPLWCNQLMHAQLNGGLDSYQSID